jgi:hypothetical protein
MKKEQLYDIIVKYLPIGFSVVDKAGLIIFTLPKDKQ